MLLRICGAASFVACTFVAASAVAAEPTPLGDEPRAPAAQAASGARGGASASANTSAIGNANANAKTAPPPPASPTELAKKEEARAYFKKGVALFSDGDSAGALVEFQKSRDTYPTMAATKNIAVCLQNLKRYKEAREMYETLLREYPNLPAEDAEAAKKSIAEIDAIEQQFAGGGSSSSTDASKPSSAPRAYINRPDAHPDYRLEIAALGHFNLLRNFGSTTVNSMGQSQSVYKPEGGGGVRVTIELFDPVIPSVNNTIGLSLGFDVTNCAYCAQVKYRLYSSAAVQWNFFVTPTISLFPEIGVVVGGVGAYESVSPDVTAVAGLRYQITPWMTAQVRVGVPFVSAGLSFMAF